MGTRLPRHILASMPSENLELLQGIYRRWATGDFRTVDVYDGGFTITMGKDFPDAGVHAGLDGVAAYMRGFLEPWERLTIEAEELTDSNEDLVLVRVLQTGIGAGSGIEVELRYFQLWTFSEGRPVAMETIMNEDEARTRFEAA